ncbi:MAG: hypothetical protein QXX57_04485 [Nitrososphaerota archaeon]
MKAAVDTDVLAIYHLFRKDRRSSVNERFLASVRGRAMTTIHNVLELCGLFALAGMLSAVEEVQLKYLRIARDIQVFFPDPEPDWGLYVESLTKYIGRGLSYGDAVVAKAVEQSEAGFFITWNKKHFDKKLNIPVYTPEEFLMK